MGGSGVLFLCVALWLLIERLFTIFVLYLVLLVCLVDLVWHCDPIVGELGPGGFAFFGLWRGCCLSWFVFCSSWCDYVL